MESPLIGWRRDLTRPRRRGKPGPSARRRRVLLGALLLGGAGFACGAERPAPANLILITVDTLRADRVGAYGNPLGLTPGIDAISERGLRFTAAYASAPSTFPSIVGLLTGRHPEQTGAVNNYGYLSPAIPTLASHLRARGWRTAAVVSNYVLSERSGLAAGFDRYDATFPQAEAVRRVPERVAADTRADALRLVDAMGRGDAPLFLWVHFQDPHGPYTPPGDLAERYLEEEMASRDGAVLLPILESVRGMGGIPDYQALPGSREAGRYRAAYDGEVRYADDEIGRLLEGLDERGLLAGSVVVFAADHGEGMGEDDYWFAHGEYLSDALLRVPLIIAAPGLAPGARGDLVSLVDVFPTVAGLLGVAPPAGLPGRDLFAITRAGDAPRAYFMSLPKESTRPRFGLASGGYRYVLTVEADGIREALFELGSDGENLLAERPGPARRMRAALSALREEFPEAGRGDKRVLSAGEREKLRSLGYVSE